MPVYEIEQYEVHVQKFQVEAVTVTVRKPEAPVKGVFFDAVGVRVRRERKREEGA